MAETSIFPYLEQIKDQPVKLALRFLGDQVKRVTLAAQGGVQGTLSPDQKPAVSTLSLKDVGTTFFSTDFARGYRWTGTAWEDLPDAPSRFAVVLFGQTPEPPIGWAPCDGRNVTRSTSSGGVTAYTTPTVPPYANLQFWVRL